ncbi:unnamed protein product [Adineta steineri]|uniref:Thioesterase domain-containing protein n=1 Tax=Adineta steineri TaxID=433720 RepID=A0A818VPK1_9BILA|nr:unnamed protein product [Adineta steineri]CAF3714128.1 unnamed protein product [Adineta steineri]
MSVCRIVRPCYNLLKREQSVSTLSSYRDRSFYKYFIDMQTRLRDNDYYGHVNNVVYGEWIDTIVNKYLIDKCSLQPLKSPLIGYVVSSHCEYYSPVSYPSTISLGLFIKKLGKSSVDYQVGIFENNQSLKASAVGGFTHVFVDRTTQRPHPIDQEFRNKLSLILN